MTKAPEVHLTRPAKTQWSPQLELQGTLVPRQTVSLAFPVPGTLSWLQAKVGDEVEAGAKLAGLDTSHLNVEAATMAAHVLAASAQLELASDNATRSAALVTTGSQSRMGATQSALQASMASAQLQAARAQNALSQVSLRDHTLRAPFAGTVVEAPDGVGAVVAPGQKLFRLVDLSSLKLDATMSDADSRLVKPGDKVRIETDHGQVEGRISAILPALEERTRRVPVFAQFDEPGALRAGALTVARVITDQPVDVLRLPQDVLRPGSQDEVLVVHPGSPATLAVRQIAYVRDVDGDLLVRSGLTADESVVLAPESDAKTGDPVSFAAAPAAGTQPQ